MKEVTRYYITTKEAHTEAGWAWRTHYTCDCSCDEAKQAGPDALFLYHESTMWCDIFLPNEVVEITKEDYEELTDDGTNEDNNVTVSALVLRRLLEGANEYKMFLEEGVNDESDTYLQLQILLFENAITEAEQKLKRNKCPRCGIELPANKTGWCSECDVELAYENR